MAVQSSQSVSAGTRHRIVAADCAAQIFATNGELWTELAGRRVFVAGDWCGALAWMLELLVAAINLKGFGCEVVVLVSDPKAFATGPVGHLASHPSLRLWSGECASFVFPSKPFHSIVYFSSGDEQSGSAAKDRHSIAAIEHVLKFAAAAGVTRFLVVNRAAIYGRNLPSRPVVEADLEDLANGWADDGVAVPLRAIERAVLAAGHRSSAFRAVAARCFPGIGPYFVSEKTNAGSEMIAEAARRELSFQPNTNPVTSVMYGGDLAMWLWTLLLRAPGNAAWNVGSSEPLPLRTVAEVAALNTNRNIQLPMSVPSAPVTPLAWFVPDTTKAQAALGLRQTVPLAQAIRRTRMWCHDLETTA